MTTPRFADCRCGHTRDAHDTPEMRPQCIRAGCNCLQYRPATAPTEQRSPSTGHPTMTAATAPTPDQLIAAGKRSDVKSIVNLAEKISGLLAELRLRIDADREAAQVRAEVAELQEKLAAARAKMPTKRSYTKTAADKVCPECAKTGIKNLGSHRFKAHGVAAAS